MSILKDYIAYARSYVNPKLSEEAAQYLIQAYVGKKTLVVDCLPNNICVRWSRYSWLKISWHSTHLPHFENCYFQTVTVFLFLPSLQSSPTISLCPEPGKVKGRRWLTYQATPFHLPPGLECWPFNWSSSGYQYVIPLTQWKGASHEIYPGLFLLIEMRQVGSSRGAVTAYPRQLESLIRLAEAHARMRLSSKVENVDVEEARRYVKISWKLYLGTWR